MTRGAAFVISRRFEALKAAIEQRSWDDVEWHFDNTYSAVSKMLGTRQRDSDEGNAPQPSGVADQDAINRVIDRDGRNGRYGFTRADVIRQLVVEADLAGMSALASGRRGARSTMIKPEALLHLAALARAALTGRETAEPDADTNPTRPTVGS